MLSEIQKVFFESKFSRTENNDFYIFEKGKQIPREGFKIHISANKRNWQEIISVSFPVLNELKGAFKIIKNRKNFFESFHDETSNLLGKFITIYPIDINEFREISEKLKNELINFSSPISQSDRWIPGSECVSYRYGSFNELFLKNGELDNRAFYHLPSYVNEPFDEVDSQADYMQGISDKYYFIKLLARKQYSKVILVRNQDDELFVMKEARKGFSIVGDISALDLRRNEFNISNRLVNEILVANPVEEIEGKYSNFFVYSFIENKAIDMNVLIDNKKDLNIITNQLNNLLDYIEQLWKLGVKINDFSTNNFILSNEDKWVYIDWELSSLNNEIPLNVSTKFNQLIISTDEIEKMKVIEMIFNLLFSNRFYDDDSSKNDILFTLNMLLKNIGFDQKIIARINSLVSYGDSDFEKSNMRLNTIFKSNLDFYNSITKNEVEKLVESKFKPRKGEIVFKNDMPYVFDGKAYNPHLDGGTLSVIFEQYKVSGVVDQNLLKILELSWTYKNGYYGLHGMILICLLLNIKNEQFTEKVLCLSMNELFGTGELDE